MKWENVKPQDIEKRSFEIIESELPRALDPELAPIIKRVIHTTADFSFADTVCASVNAVETALDALRKGACIITDTNMTMAGINKALLTKHGGKTLCFMADSDVAEYAKNRGVTRAVASIDKAANIQGPLIFAIGNAPTALGRLCELTAEDIIKPTFVIGVPVGFVNVVESKEILMQSGLAYITAKGRRGGSTVAAAICNALLLML